MTERADMTLPPDISDRALRLPDVERASGYRRSTIYDKVAKGEFPAPFRLGERAVAWSAQEVAAWVAARKEARDKAADKEVNAHAA